jgi:flagellar biosynthesis protein FliQ
MKKISKIIGGVIYSIGTCITLLLSIIYLSHSDIIINPDAMLPFQLYEEAFMLLAFGAIPMVIACYVVYKVYEIKNSYHHKRNRIIIFIPGIICVSCATFIFGLLFVGMINSFILH